MKVRVEFDDLPVWRDKTHNFEPLEELFGTLCSGCCFG
jgi:hypothetical protein